MDKNEKIIKILYVRHVFEKSFTSVLSKQNIDKDNFYKGQVASKKIDALFDSIYSDLEQYLAMGTLIKNGELDKISDLLEKKEAIKNE